MASVWSIIAFWILPIPLALFALLSLPLPRNVRRGILIFTQRVFDFPVIGAFKLLHVMLWLTAVAFLGSVRQASMIRQAAQDASYATPGMEISHLSKRWRAERNLWMTAFAFSAWVFLAALYREAARRIDLESRLAEFERSDYTAGDTREPSVSREVTSKAARDRATPTGPSAPQPAKPAPVQPAVVDPVGSVPGGSAVGGGVQMQELKKEL